MLTVYYVMSCVVPTLPLSQLRLIAGIQDKKKKRLLIIYIVHIYTVLLGMRVLFVLTTRFINYVSCRSSTFVGYILTYINYNTSYYFSRAVHTRAAGAAAAYLEPTNERPSVSYVGNSCIRDIRVV